MVGDSSKNDKSFTPDNYEGFYEHHYFEPLSETVAFSANEYIPRFGWAFDKIEEIKPEELLDLGCLDGSFALTVADKLGVKVVGIDLTKEGISLATERAENNGLDAVFYQGAAEEWLERFIEEGRKFDVVTCFEMLEHVKDPKKLLGLIDKVLAYKGSVLVSTPAFESPVWGLDDEQNTCHIRLYTTHNE